MVGNVIQIKSGITINIDESVKKKKKKKKSAKKIIFIILLHLVVNM